LPRHRRRRDFVLRTLATAFGDRPCTWQVIQKGLAVASFQTKQIALQAIVEGEVYRKKTR
jgi:hypothetical protein